MSRSYSTHDAGYQTTSMAHCDAGGGAVHSIKSGPSATPPGESAPGGEADGFPQKADTGPACRLSG